jgi:Protein of unknown function (DUF4054)
MSQLPAVITFDPNIFRAQFTAFSDEVKFPDSLLEMYWEQVTCFISDNNYGSLVNECRQLALNTLLAHFLSLMNAVNSGQQSGFVTNSTVGSVSVAQLAPPSPDGFSWWLNQTPYGQQLLAMLEAKSVGGWYIGFYPESSGFRKVNGWF